MSKTGDILIEEGLVGPKDVARALTIQEKKRMSLTRDRGRLFGMVLCDLNLVTPLDNYCTLEKYGKLISVKAFLVRKNIVTQKHIDRAEARAKEKNIPFISYLLEEQIVPRAVLRQILFDLFHIPFRSVSDIVFDKTGRDILSGIIDDARAGYHKVIPLQLRDNTLLVGITDPGNLIFVRELDQKFPQYRFNPVFIPFSGFTWFYKLLYRKSWKASSAANHNRVDLSQLMNVSVSVTDPDRDREAILALYDRYESALSQGRKETGAPDRGRQERSNMFFEFIRRHHEQIISQYYCSSVVFSLKEDNGRVLVMAMPGKEIHPSWQK